MAEGWFALVSASRELRANSRASIAQSNRLIASSQALLGDSYAYWRLSKVYRGWQPVMAIRPELLTNILIYRGRLSMTRGL
jgi:hypothetical protein